SVVAALFAFLAFTRAGKAMRAVADNPVLAGIKGINAENIGRLVSFVGMGLAGLGGMLLGLDTSIDPLTGFRAIVSMFVAAAVGAYVSALLTLKLGAPIAVGMVAGALAAAAVGAVVSLIPARLRGDYLAIVTLGFAETIRVVASNEIWLTNGTDGLSGIAGPWRGVLTPEAFNLVYLCLVA